MNAYNVQSVHDVPMDPRMGKYADPFWREPQSSIDAAMEKVIEWDWAQDAHGYCHDRNILLGLLAEIERLRAVDPTTPGGEKP